MNPKIVYGNIIEQNVEVIVNSWNRNIIPWWLLLPQGVSKAIKNKGGYAPFKEIAKLGPIELGGARITTAGTKNSKRTAEKTITLGGCMVHENAPLWMCAICSCKFDHPVNKEQALKIVQNIITNWNLPEGDKYIVVESGTIEKEWGWVFFYTSKKYFQTNDINYAVAGNAPFIVLRKSGRVIETGTAYPIEHYINRFEETSDPHS